MVDIEKPENKRLMTRVTVYFNEWCDQRSAMNNEVKRQIMIMHCLTFALLEKLTRVKLFSLCLYMRSYLIYGTPLKTDLLKSDRVGFSTPIFAFFVVVVVVVVVVVSGGGGGGGGGTVVCVCVCVCVCDSFLLNSIKSAASNLQ